MNQIENKENERSWVIYFIGSVLFLLLPIFSSPDFSWDFHFLSVKQFQRSFVSYATLLLLFYALTFWVLPRFFFTKRYLLFGFLLLISFALFFILPSYIIPMHHFDMPPHHEGEHFRKPFPHPKNHFLFSIAQNLFQFSVVSIFSYSLIVYARWKKAEQTIVEAELAYLKAQINPHFLFNTLNSIYSLAIQKSDATADAIAQLSNMMRYVLTDATQHKVSLQKEIDYLKDYVSLQSTRISKNVLFNFEIKGEASGQQIAPMLLVPLLENAFKYGVNPDEECYIYILIDISEKEFVFTAKNKKISAKIEDIQSNKMGIENVRKRLLAAYPTSSQMFINDDENIFIATLKIYF